MNHFLVEGVAKAGLGEPFVVTHPSQALAVANRFRGYIRSPVLTDIRIRFPGFDAYDVEPAAFPDVLADRPLVVHGKWRGKATGTIEVSGISGEGRYARSFAVGESKPSPDHRALRYLWVRTRVSNLWAFAPGRLTDDQRSEVVRLGLTYEVLTAFTSFVAVHDVVRNAGGDGREVAQPLPLPEGVSERAVGGMDVGDEPELIALLLALGAIAIVQHLRRPASEARRL